MASYNKITLLGNVGNDPVLKEVGQDRKVTEVSIAINEPARGNQPEKTEWYRVSFWDKKAEIIANYVRKGNQLFVEGKLSLRTYQDKENNTRYALEVLGTDFTLLGSRDPAEVPESSFKPVTASPAPQKQAAGSPAADVPPAFLKEGSDDDLPF